MINVDIYFPTLDKIYDLQVDETVSIGALIAEITDMLGSGKREEKSQDDRHFMLCSVEKKQILRKNMTLNSYGIKNGSQLMLV